MCGIAGQIGYDQDLRTQRETITKMQAALRRRGPDQEGLFLAPHAQLAHTRLCVIDPVNGRQPMTARREGRTCTLVYNGELYNTEDLRRELAAAGWGFSGHSDTEVLLKSYLEWGEDCVERFNGIFAFAVWEAEAETLFLARDLPGMADVDSSLLLFCQAVRKDVTVAVSGECADEIFGGYPWFRDPSVRPENGFPWAQSTAWRASFLTPEYAKRLDAGDIVRQRYRATLRQAECLDSDTDEQKRVRRLMRLNTDWFMQTLLGRKDRMSMWSALEVRVPFCDWRIAEYLYNVPPELRELGGQEKGLLRAAVGDLLPESVLHRKKSPYPKTVHPAYLRLVSMGLERLLDEDASPLFAFVRREALEELLSCNSAQPWYGQLMTVPQTIAYFLQMDHWLRTYQVRLV